MIVREGDTYRLALPPSADVDVRNFERALELARRARLAGDLQAAVEAFDQAATIGRAELLPEDGSAEWVVERRARLRASAAEMARTLAIRLVSSDMPEVAARVAAAGVEADRYDDALWRALIDARTKAGDEAGSRRAQADYRAMLDGLESPTGS